MELNSPIKEKKKRTVNKAEWTKEKRKRLRIAGKEYVNAKGEVVAEKEPGPDCRCRRKCYERVPKTTRLKLFRGYYALKSHDEQNAYLFSLIRKVPIARKRAEGSTRRTCTFNYYIRVGGQETQVCVKALANIHGIGKSKIHILCEKLGQNILFPRDERGRHSKMPKKVSEETVVMVKQHIFNIIHSDRAREFLKDEKANNGPDVNITQMHKDFLDTYDPEFAHEMAQYEKLHPEASREADPFDSTYTEYRYHCEEEDKDVRVVCEYSTTSADDSNQPVQVILDSEGNAHQVLAAAEPVTITQQQQQQQPRGRKRKTSRDGRPEPLIRQWYYSKIFHDLYTTKEAIALRKKILSWKCSEDFITVKPVRKQRTSKKQQNTNNGLVSGLSNLANMQQVQHVILQPAQNQSQMEHHNLLEPQPHAQVHLVQARLNKGTNTFSIPITAQHLPNKKIVHEVQLQNIPIKKKPVQVFQATGPDMYSIYPMILQDLAQIDPLSSGQQTIQHAQLRAIAPAHGAHSSAMTITTGNLQTIGVNINLAQQGNHFTSSHPTIMSYKFE